MQEPGGILPGTGGFEGDVQDAIELPASQTRIPGALDVRVKIVAGRPRRGSARLVARDGDVILVTIVGFAQWRFPYGERMQHDFMVIYPLIIGVPLADVHTGQQLLQDPEPIDTSPEHGSHAY